MERVRIRRRPGGLRDAMAAGSELGRGLKEAWDGLGLPLIRPPGWDEALLVLLAVAVITLLPVLAASGSME